MVTTLYWAETINDMNQYSHFRKGDAFLLAGDLMQTRLITVFPHTQLKDIVQLMLAEQIDAIPVIDEDHHIKGIVSASDFLRMFLPQQVLFLDMPIIMERSRIKQEVAGSLRNLCAQDIMTRPVICAEPDSDIGKIAGLMLIHGINQIPIINSNKMIGFIDRADVIRYLAQDLL
jgi:CBS domain-containing protein